ncbi:MAG TPA: chemotaxis protein CheB [Planctomycetota bacterium]|nr:chemotaxis protein CheB [Planctomycetota bacterium]
MNQDLIVIGGSAGGLEAVTQIVRDLPKDLPAAVFVVLHLVPTYPSAIARLLDRAGDLPAFHPRDGQKIRHRNIYVAPPDRHLLIEGNVVRVLKGPSENLHRPAIDPLFRSAAFYGRSRVAGILLTGADMDGTAGLFSIKMRHGVTIVQDPQEALVPLMPGSALKHVEIDYKLRLREMPPLIDRLARGRLGRGPKEGGSSVAV